MADIVKLLPENIANQIAAGEVVQRPASVVKELLENAIDAKATTITLFVKDGGKTLIQVTDNGTGMSPTDARRCFERHATSKIATVEDLFSITTKGFRGEAMAAISSVSQVELKTKRSSDENGTHTIVEGGKFLPQEVCATHNGTSIFVKNLFFNIPARRNFLKEDGVEMRLITDEVERIAIPHLDIHLKVIANGNELYNLQPAGLIQRITAILGNSLKDKLVSVKENSPSLSVSGYVGIPSSSRKRRGQQFFFVNNRFIRNGYLHHAVMSAYEQLIPTGEFPTYVLFLTIPPENIDINIHPTKTEVKFTDEKNVYGILNAAVKRALGRNNLSPSIDFNPESIVSFNSPSKNFQGNPTLKWNTQYSPFETAALKNPNGQSDQNWDEKFNTFNGKQNTLPTSESELFGENSVPLPSTDKVIQLHLRYIAVQDQQGLILIDQQRAHERILFEHYLNANKSPLNSQQQLFPQTLELSPADFILATELLPELTSLGFDLQPLGKNTFVIQGIPADLTELNSEEVLNGLIENYKLNNLEITLEKQENICRALARNTSIRYGKELKRDEMAALVEHLFRCENFSHSPSGKPVFARIEINEIDKLLRRNT